jgi:hypothetical protein
LYSSFQPTLIKLFPREKLVGSIPNTWVQSPAITTTILFLKSLVHWNEGELGCKILGMR